MSRRTAILKKQLIAEGGAMRHKPFYAPVRILSFIVLAAMAAAIIYAFSISLLYWSGIGV